MKRVYFYSPGATGDVYSYRGRSLFVNTVPAYLHSALIQQRPDLAQQITWSKIQLLEKTTQEIARDIESMQIDLFCASLYIWNQYHVLEVINELRRYITRDIKIIVGGPSVDPHRDQDYFVNNHEIDYAIFAQGEKAFVAVLDHVINHKAPRFFSAKNLAWPDTSRKVKKSEYEFIKRSQGSPYLDSREILQQIAHDPDYQGYTFYFPYETSKGCPYNCSFCDWTSGLSHKVSHRVENNWEQELDLLGSLGFTNLHVSDANFGQHRQDIDIAKVMVRLKNERGYQFSIIDTNFSKLRKRESFEILDVLLGAGIIRNPKFAVQDTNAQVLQDIERPDVPWIEHKAYILKMLEKYPDTECEIEIIQGLPGQTRDTWKQTLLDIQGFNLRSYPWVLLPNAPAGYDPEYRQRMQISMMNLRMEGLNDQPQQVIVSTYSYDFDDYMYMTLLSRFMHTYIKHMEDRKLLFDRVDHSKYLSITIKDMGDAFRNEQKLWPLIYRFMDHLFAEYTEWPQDILDRRRRALEKNNETQ